MVNNTDKAIRAVLFAFAEAMDCTNNEPGDVWAEIYTADVDWKLIDVQALDYIRAAVNSVAGDYADQPKTYNNLCVLLVALDQHIPVQETEYVFSAN